MVLVLLFFMMCVVNTTKFIKIMPKDMAAVYIYNCCRKVHRFKTHSESCIMCCLACIAFMMRDTNKSIVYISKSDRYYKVGMIENKRKTDRDLLTHHGYKLNSEDGYDGMTGWKIVRS